MGIMVGESEGGDINFVTTEELKEILKQPARWTVFMESYLADKLPGVEVSVERQMSGGEQERLDWHHTVPEKLGWLWRRLTGRMRVSQVRWEYALCFTKEYVALRLQDCSGESFHVTPRELGVQVMLTERLVETEDLASTCAVLDLVVKTTRQAFLRFHPTT